VRALAPDQFQEMMCAANIGRDKSAGVTDGVVDVGFSRQMEHGIGPIQVRKVTDVRSCQTEPIRTCGEKIEARGIGSLVDADDVVPPRQQLLHEGPTDEAGTAGHEADAVRHLTPQAHDLALEAQRLSLPF
jgi:hypothetical protein